MKKPTEIARTDDLEFGAPTISTISAGQLSGVEHHDVGEPATHAVIVI
ncbi:hypothetical protein ACPUER_13645 [Burkholderia sp. DN3021]